MMEMKTGIKTLVMEQVETETGMETLAGDLMGIRMETLILVSKTHFSFRDDADNTILYSITYKCV